MTDPTPEQMRDLLIKCRRQFAFYAQNHRAKIAPLRQRLDVTKDTSPTADKLRKQIDDTRVKAMENEGWVAAIDKLVGPPETVRSPDTKAVDQG